MSDQARRLDILTQFEIRKWRPGGMRPRVLLIRCEANKLKSCVHFHSVTAATSGPRGVQSLRRKLFDRGLERASMDDRFSLEASRFPCILQ